jgi:hypothetical protein
MIAADLAKIAETKAYEAVRHLPCDLCGRRAESKEYPIAVGTSPNFTGVLCRNCLDWQRKQLK